MWIHRAHANLFDAGIGGLKFTPAWSVGWFFVPIANLFKPFQAMRELWNASYDSSDRYSRATPPDLTIWWRLFIVSNILMNMGTRMEATPASQSIGLILSIAGTTGSIACAWFLMRIIKQVTDAQHSTMGINETFA
jgi:hypothetical protein